MQWQDGEQRCLRQVRKLVIMPTIPIGDGWERLVDTDAYVRGDGGLADHRSYVDGAVFELAALSLVVMIRGRR